jgi:alcohol dehydrogenase class IV
VEAVLGERLAGHFNGVREQSPVSAVIAGVEALKDAHADAVIAVGGGSAIVTARAASILLAEDRDVRELCTQRGTDGKFFSPKLLEPKLPHWVIPTTATTAYAKAGSALRDDETGERLALFDPKTRAQGVFLDPQLSLTAPIGLTLSAGLNAFAMAVEGLQSSLDDPLAVALLTQAIRILNESLLHLRREPENPEPRLRSMVAALLSGQGTDYAGGGLAQVLSHAAGPYSSVSNGLVEALVLPSAMRYNRSANSEWIVLIGQVIGNTGSPSGDEVHGTVGAVEKLLRGLGVPSRLRDVDISRESISEIVDHALDDWALSRVPRPAGRQDLETLLNDIW